jgi:hypothetical protein
MAKQRTRARATTMRGQEAATSELQPPRVAGMWPEGAFEIK